METIRRTVRVTIEKEIEIEINPSLFGKMSEEEYLEEFSKSLWYIESVDDIIEYAARMAAYYGGGPYDGLGLMSAHYCPNDCDVRFKELSDECEVELLETSNQ